ncbi:MAG: hypothetical protein JWO62_1894, partial [Acidimicrobiaceae bacterium]|nr:hypothetical protein [Acidimicrobiaceae bacterium]
VHPAELARLGVAPGGQVRLRSARGELVVDVAGDPALERGVVVLDANVLPAGAARAVAERAVPESEVAAWLVAADAVVTDVRLETV